MTYQTIVIFSSMTWKIHTIRSGTHIIEHIGVVKFELWCGEIRYWCDEIQNHKIVFLHLIPLYITKPQNQLLEK